MRLFVTAIGTDSGKTVASAMLTEALKADYWKPIQAGSPTDSETVRSLVDNPTSRILPEGIILKTPASPHAAAIIDQVMLTADMFVLPDSSSLIVEGAGGLLVPINDRETILDMALGFNIPIVLVADLYLGSINHTLLSCEMLKRTGAKVEGIIFNGEPNAESQRIIELRSDFRILYHILPQEKIDSEAIKALATDFIDKNPDYAKYA